MKQFANYRRYSGLLIVGIWLSAHPLLADIMTLTNQNSSVQIDPTSQAGLYNWTVNGKNIMYQQWFWIRTGSATSEIPVDSSTLKLTGESALGGHGLLAYAGSNYTVTMRFSLLGGGPGTDASDLSEIISLKNTSSTPLTLNFFQYANIAFSNGDDTIQFVSPDSVEQSGDGIWLNETVVNSNGLVHHQADVYPNILNSLDNNSITTLDDSNYATGDATWAFQWQQTLAPGSTFIITKDLNVSDPPPAVPEPASVILLGTLIAFVSFRAHRHKPRPFTL